MRASGPRLSQVGNDMKVVVIGGAGAFGSRLAEMLIRDGHQVIVAGRGAATQAAAKRLGAEPLIVDRAGDLSPLWAIAPDVVVDAAGPFHAYGNDPYRLPRAAIAAGVHYLDLSDDAEFCAGIADLDEAAGAAGVVVLSGMSSVPAISSAAVSAVTPEAAAIDTIDTAILPGNRAPRGRSVVESILHQVGRPMSISYDAVPDAPRSWSRPDTYRIDDQTTRRGWMIAVPDQRLFPQAFGARTVIFRAGLELAVMNYALAAISALRLKVPSWGVGVLLRLARWLKPFGSDVGGMVVRVVYERAGEWRRAVWRLRVGAGDGPCIPGVAARAALRDIASMAAGARPAVSAVSFDAIAEAMADLQVTMTQEDTTIAPLFPRFLGEAASGLPPQVRALHDVPAPRRWAGRAVITHGAGLWPRLIATLFGFPAAAKDVPVIVSMSPQNGGELWERRFAGKAFQSFLKVRNGRMTERFGILTFALDLHVADGRLHYPVVSGRCGPLPLPRWLLPISIASEHEADGRFHFDVALKAPLTHGLMVHYRGWLVRASGLGD